MENAARIESSPPPPHDESVDQSGYGVEYTAEFHELDTMVSAFDSEGLGPLRKGERPFQWDIVASSSESLLAQSPDLRVAIWLLRALLQLKGVAGLVEGLSRIRTLLSLPEAELFPRAVDAEPAREAHAVTVAWVGSSTLLHQLRTAQLASNIPLTIADMRRDDGLAMALDSTVKAELAATFQQGVNHLDHIAHVLQQDGTYLSFNVAPLRDEMAFASKILGAKERTSEVVNSNGNTAIAPPYPATNNSGINKREDVQRTLAALIDYFKENEPSHPAPLLLLRVQRMLGVSFEELMNELYSDANQLVARIEKPQPL